LSFLPIFLDEEQERRFPFFKSLKFDWLKLETELRRWLRIMEQSKTDENRFIDLAFLNSKKSDNWISTQPIFHPKKAGLTVPMTHPIHPSRRRDTPVRMAGLKSEIEFEFGEKPLRNPVIVRIRTQIQAIQNERGIKIFVFRSNRPAKEQTDCITKIAELLAGQEKTKILLINGLCQSRKTSTGIIPIYQVIRKSDIVNLYFMSLEGFFSEDDPGQQKRMQELMQLFEISFNYILINQLVRQSLAVETFLGQSPAQRFKLLFPGSHPN